MPTYTEYSANPQDNQNPVPVGAPEGWAGKDVNEVIRYAMAVIRSLGDSTLKVDGTNITGASIAGSMAVEDKNDYLTAAGYLDGNGFIGVATTAHKLGPSPTTSVTPSSYFLTLLPATTASAMRTLLGTDYSLTASGAILCLRLPGGVYLQAGSVSTSGSGVSSVSFTVPFPNACTGVYGTAVAAGATTAIRCFDLTAAPTTSGFSCQVVDASGSRVPTTAYWFAVGN